MMLKYRDIAIGLQEIPNEVSLVINIANCPFKCKGCNTKHLWEDSGELLSYENLEMLIDSTIQDITCVLFMGGDVAPDEINELAAYIRNHYPDLKIGWYSGGETITVFTEYQNFDYLKFGPFIKKLGPLSSPKTNQRLYKVEGGVLRNITRLYGNLPNKMKSQLVSDTLAVVIFYLARHEFFSNFAGASVH